MLLQIAKNAAAPDEPGAVKEFNGAVDAQRPGCAKDAEVVGVGAAEPTGDKKGDATEAASAAAEGMKSPSSSSSSVPTAAHHPPENPAAAAAAAAAGTPGIVKPDKKSAIPEISYSSSDDDDFYDAEEQGRPAPGSSRGRAVLKDTFKHSKSDFWSFKMIQPSCTNMQQFR